MEELRDCICVGSDGWPQVGGGTRRGGRHFWPLDRRGHCCHEWVRSGPEFSQGQGKGGAGRGSHCGAEAGSPDSGPGRGRRWLVAVRRRPRVWFGLVFTSEVRFNV